MEEMKKTWRKLVIHGGNEKNVERISKTCENEEKLEKNDEENV